VEVGDGQRSAVVLDLLRHGDRALRWCQRGEPLHVADAQESRLRRVAELAEIVGQSEATTDHAREIMSIDGYAGPQSSYLDESAAATQVTLRLNAPDCQP
jgi:hypothetical protein